MTFYYSNLVDTASSVTGSSAASGLPASNVQNQLIPRVWRTGTSTAAETITFDFGTAQTPTAAIIAGHTLTSGDSSIQVRGSTDNFSSSDVLVATFTYASTHMLKAISGSYRYWRIAFTKASSGVARDIGKIYIGTTYTTEEEPDWDGFEETTVDPTVTARSIGGQTYSDARPTYRRWTWNYNSIGDTMAASLRTMIRTVGKSQTLFAQVSASSPFDEVLYVKLTKDYSRKVSGYAAWNISIEAQEDV
jgi:hypothetical protein